MEFASQIVKKKDISIARKCHFFFFLSFHRHLVRPQFHLMLHSNSITEYSKETKKKTVRTYIMLSNSPELI